MSKPHRETQLHRGEQQLKEWNIAADADVQALRSLIGRNADADLAIAARLGTHAEPASVEALLALEAGSTDKLVRKEVRRSLYRLEQRGVTIPHAPATKPAVTVTAPALEGYLSAVDGGGDQLVWLLKPRPGGLAHLFAVINDPDGLREIDLAETTRKALRAAQEELIKKHALRLVEADWRYCDHLVDRAFRWATDQHHPISGDYRARRAQLIKEPPTEMRPLIFTRLEADTVRGDARLLVESDKPLEENEFRTWFFDPETLKPYIDEMQRIKDSPLVLHPSQQQERFNAIVERAIEELFGGARQPSWVRRLEEMAYFFHATKRIDQARRALAAALALEANTRGGREIPLCEQLVRTSLAAFLQVEQQREEEQARSSLVLTPQQAVREAQRRRPS